MIIDYFVHCLSKFRSNVACTRKCLKQMQQSWPLVGHALSVKRITGGINGGLINHTTLKSLDYKRDFLFPLSLLLHNTRPVGRQVLQIGPLWCLNVG